MYYFKTTAPTLTKMINVYAPDILNLADIKIVTIRELPRKILFSFEYQTSGV
jgi:hypothetical protein